MPFYTIGWLWTTILFGDFLFSSSVRVLALAARLPSAGVIPTLPIWGCSFYRECYRGTNNDEG
jgi:hypothetical protein